jgi:hypothetical protein
LDVDEYAAAYRLTLSSTLHLVCGLAPGDLLAL